MKENTVYAIIITIIVVGGIGIGLALGGAIPSGSQSTPQASDTSGPYNLNLVEIMDGNFNSSVGAQPIYYVEQNGMLTSSANISLPADRAIHVSIVAYDMGNASANPQYLKVVGTVGNVVTIIKGIIASSVNVSQTWEANLSTFSAAMVLHTFTILNGANTILNIPVIAGDTEYATFYLNTTGSFIWQCEAACGTGPSGWDASMSTSGWMTGTVYVSS